MPVVISLLQRKFFEGAGIETTRELREALSGKRPLRERACLARSFQYGVAPSVITVRRIKCDILDTTRC
jgi:hypothetical protein